MSLCRWLILVVLISTTTGKDPGVKVRLTQKGLEYGRQLGMVSIEQKLKSVKIPDMSGKQKVSPIGKVKYSLSNIQMVNVRLPQSAVALVPGTGVRLSIGNANLSLRGNWRVKYLRIIKNSGSFDLNVNGLTIGTGIAIKSDETGRPAVSAVNCAANVGSVNVKFHGELGVLIETICPLVAKAISDLNPQLKTLNVLAKVDKFAEIDYSMVASPTVSQTSIDLSLKPSEPPFLPAPFSLPPQNNNMLYIGMSTFTINSAGFVYNRAGVLSLNITDDMIARQFPGLMVKMLVKTSKAPGISFQPNNMTVETVGTVTAFAIQPNGTLSPLFVLNLDTSVSARVFASGMRLAGAVTLNKIGLTLATSYVGEFQVRSLDSILGVVLRLVVIPQLNVQLAKGYPLPAIGKMKLVNTQLQVLKDYMLIGTDVQFTR
ncbi:hypothetical protein INR49_016772 [Caranx melampygus]|nr:hypothetical protein INR49_016772 [Caranx melampygus]